MSFNLKEKNPYDVLGISHDVSLEEAKKAYLRKVKQFHPDRFVDEQDKLEATEKLKAVNVAFDNIKNNNVFNDAAGSGFSQSQFDDYMNSMFAEMDNMSDEEFMHHMDKILNGMSKGRPDEGNSGLDEDAFDYDFFYEQAKAQVLKTEEGQKLYQDINNLRSTRASDKSLSRKFMIATAVSTTVSTCLALGGSIYDSSIINYIGSGGIALSVLPLTYAGYKDIKTTNYLEEHMLDEALHGLIHNQVVKNKEAAENDYVPDTTVVIESPLKQLTT